MMMWPPSVRPAIVALLAFVAVGAPCDLWARGAEALPAWKTQALQASQRALRSPASRAAAYWLQCAARAFEGVQASEGTERDDAIQLANGCTEHVLSHALDGRRTWAPGPVRLAGAEVVLQVRGVSPHLHAPLRLMTASRVPMTLYGGTRHARPGFGVPLAAVGTRCGDAPLCTLLPPEGVFRSVTAWVEPGDTPASPPLLVLTDPLRGEGPPAGGGAIPLAVDTSAAYAFGASHSPLRRLGVWGLLGGDEVGRRAGLYLLEDYDPQKQPIVMLHGLGSHPLAWARLSNALWGDPALRARFQVWHVVYQTDAPLLMTRRRIQGYLDDAWRILDPEGDDPARHGLVLVGHSMGGVLARLLCVESGDALWNAAFTVPPGALPGEADDVALIDATFRFTPYPGVTRAVFLASPHQGSPSAERWYGRLMRALVGRRAPELQALRRIARAHPDAIDKAVVASYQQARLNSIATLQPAQPVRRAGEHLMPVAGIAYHTIAGAQPGVSPPGDGVVPLSSAWLPGAASTRVLAHGHDLYRDDDAVAEVLRILREDMRSPAARQGRGAGQ